VSIEPVGVGSDCHPVSHDHTCHFAIPAFDVEGIETLVEALVHDLRDFVCVIDFEFTDLALNHVHVLVAFFDW